MIDDLRGLISTMLLVAQVNKQVLLSKSACRVGKSERKTQGRASYVGGCGRTMDEGALMMDV